MRLSLTGVAGGELAGSAADGDWMTQEHQARSAFWLAFGSFVAACVLPATKDWRSTDFGRGGNVHYVTENGWVCLVLGWTLVPWAVEHGSTGMIAWLANPLALVSVTLLLFRRNTGAAAFGTASVIVGALYMIDPPRTDDHPDLPQVGAWLWVGCLLSLTVAALIRRGISKAQTQAMPTAPDPAI
jgi:hypothetical protein